MLEEGTSKEDDRGEEQEEEEKDETHARSVEERNLSEIHVNTLALLLRESGETWFGVRHRTMK